MLGNLLEGIKDITIMAGPFLVGCPIVLAIEESQKRKAMKARHAKRFAEIKENNRRRAESVQANERGVK